MECLIFFMSKAYGSEVFPVLDAAVYILVVISGQSCISSSVENEVDSLVYSSFSKETFPYFFEGD